jgi:endonuclease YncB( thermonuclease family)
MSGEQRGIVEPLGQAGTEHGKAGSSVKRQMGARPASPRTFVFLFVLLLALPVLARETITGKVVGVSDGDTLTVLVEGRRQVKVRLHGVDAPEAHQAYGSRAKQFTSRLVFGKPVRVEVRDTDRYGRTIAEVFLPDWSSLNREVVRAGMAWWYRRYAPNDRQLAALEDEARRARRGLWADRDPISPWEFRRGSPRAHAPDPPTKPQASPNNPSRLQQASQRADTVRDIVFVTKTGRKYHRDGCRYLQTSRIEKSRKDAEAKSLTPCSVCRP